MAYFVVGYFSVPFVDAEPLREWKFVYENKVLVVYAVINSTLLVLLYFSVSSYFKISYLILFSFFTLLFSIFFNGNFPSPMFYFSILNVYVVFYVLLRSKFKFGNISRITLWILIFYVVIPVLISIFGGVINFLNNIPPLFIFSSFRGFTFDRVEYGIVAGYLLLILMVGEKKYFFTIVPFVIYGVLMTEARAIIVALLFAYLYLFRRNLKLLFFFTLSLPVLFFILIGISNRVELLDTDGGRFDFYSASIVQIFNSLLSFLWGVGEFYTPVDKYNVVPHNFIFQTLLNFGIFVFLAWTLIVMNVWSKLNDKGRVFLIYSLTLGLFHPGYDGFIFLPFSALGYYLAVFYGLNKEKYI
tara:strand:+ start:14966 stop:16036 length:1071 start_codon:yes stop_codon:yes gene_type:complete